MKRAFGREKGALQCPPGLDRGALPYPTGQSANYDEVPFDTGSRCRSHVFIVNVIAKMRLLGVGFLAVTGGAPGPKACPLVKGDRYCLSGARSSQVNPKLPFDLSRAQGYGRGVDAGTGAAIGGAFVSRFFDPAAMSAPTGRS